MCVVDSLTKCAYFIPTHTAINAEGTALLFLKEVWKCHGTPRVVVSDRGPQFIAGYTCELYKLLGIKLALSAMDIVDWDRLGEGTCGDAVELCPLNFNEAACSATVNETLCASFDCGVCGLDLHIH
jgi:hypothetical protein